MALFIDGVVKVTVFCDYCNVWKSITKSTSDIAKPLDQALMYEELKSKLIKKGWEIGILDICPSCVEENKGRENGS